MNRLQACTLALVLGCSTLTACTPDPRRGDRMDEAFLQLLAIEDRRAPSMSDVAALAAATRGDAVFLRRIGVRALGRLEDPGHAELIAPLLEDAAPSVRREAAYALAQAYQNATGTAALRVLEARLEVERDPAVRGVLAWSIGRLDLGAVEREEAARLLVDTSRDGDSHSPRVTLTGVALGAEALIRRAPGRDVPAGLVDRLEALTTYQGSSFRDPEGDRIRALAFLSLGQAGLIRHAHVQRALGDEAPQVSATAVRYLATIEADARPEAIRRSIGSASWFTVLEAIRYVATLPRDQRNCSYLFAAGRVPPANAPVDVPVGVRTTALDALSRPCPDSGQQRTLLRDVARMPGDERDAEWRPAAHALVALAVLSPSDASGLVPTFARHSNPFVRGHAARAAATIGDAGTLEGLLTDADDNVRTAALQGLYALRGHRADDAARAQLVRDDPQLILTAAGLLADGPDRRSTAEASLRALERMSEARRETWRDARLALLQRVEATGSHSDSGRLVPFLRDYDPAVADRVAGVLESWNGRPYAALPERLPPAALPTAAELRLMDDATVVLHMRGGAEIAIDLHPYVSATNTFRFYRLAGAGWFDGLTFHRWAPNFVIQGGSPHANEYYGDALFSRDEVGLTHWRGTDGISTRGHDTGDGQIFVNLMDNVRLDHTYTIVGTIVSGLEAVDSVFEGGVIERAEVREAR